MEQDTFKTPQSSLQAQLCITKLNSNANFVFDPLRGCFGHDDECDFDVIAQTFEGLDASVFSKDDAGWSSEWTAIDSTETDGVKSPLGTKARRKRKRSANAPPTEVLTLEQSNGLSAHDYHPDKATNGLGKRAIYVCGYCGYQKLSCSKAGDGQVRIRCECGGVRADGVARMHALWKRNVQNSENLGTPLTSINSTLGIDLDTYFNCELAQGVWY